jgi:hypothetical protein
VGARMEAFRESVRNLHNPLKIKDATKSEQQEEEEKMVEEMY